MVPPAPGLFSTTTCAPSEALSLGARMREIVSAVPPGGKVAISRIVPLVGQSWLALAAGATRLAAEAVEQRLKLAAGAREGLSDGRGGGLLMGQCPNCGAAALTHQEGCDVCLNCGYSRCS